jgi:glutamate carboxypeptidase
MMQSKLEAASAWLSSQQGRMIELLAELVSIDSHSSDLQGVAAVRDRLRSFLDGENVPTRLMPTSGGADCLLAELNVDEAAQAGLLLGHLDTVFMKGEAALRPFTVRDGRGYGPGVGDMKAGDVLNAFVIAACARHQLDIPLRALFTVDEEIGSPASRPVIEAIARRSRYVLNSEPGRANGNVVSGRRGGAFYRVSLKGLAAHAGLNPQDGRSAVLELAHKIQAWHALNDAASGISVSVGIVSGGLAVNMIPPVAEAQIDLRFGDLASGERAEFAIRKIAEEPIVQGVSGTFETMGKFLPMVETKASLAFLDIYLGEARKLGIEVAAEATPSCSDAGLTSSLGIPTICATGPVGGKPHSPEEYIEIDTLVPRARAALHTIGAA